MIHPVQHINLGWIELVTIKLDIHLFDKGHWRLRLQSSGVLA